ncbi:MAG: hypothetical protein H6867_09360 [Rhodospirillales bacterium]|nr:hypothetical protein [Rhodospirillales bacterium]
MTHQTLTYRSFRACALALLCATAGFICTDTAPAQAAGQPPALVITNEPLPAELRSKVYSKPSVAPQTTRVRSSARNIIMTAQKPWSAARWTIFVESCSSYRGLLQPYPKRWQPTN